ncbi:MAG: hypothetical protein J6Y82_06195 [Bacteroidales bacterium]|nr:hypothetical protein [Bacteroidales bacterium]
MKTIFNLLCVSLLLIVVGACGTDKPTIETIKPVYVKHSAVVDLESRDILSPVYIFKIDGYIVFGNWKTTTNLFTYMSDDYTKIVNGINEGNGPGELSDFVTSQRYKNDIYMVEANTKGFDKLNFTGDSIKYERISLIDGVTTGSTFSVIDNSYFLTPSLVFDNDSALLAIIGFDGKVKSILPHPAGHPLAGTHERYVFSYFVNTRVAVSPDGKHYAYGLPVEQCFGFGDIENGAFKNPKTLMYQTVEIDYSRLPYYILPAKGSIESTSRIVPSDEYAIFFYSGNDYFDTEKQTSNTILLFTWDGELCKKLILDMEIMNLDFDQSTKTLYCIAQNPEACLVTYDLSEFFED